MSTLAHYALVMYFKKTRENCTRHIVLTWCGPYFNDAPSYALIQLVVHSLNVCSIPFTADILTSTSRRMIVSISECSDSWHVRINASHIVLLQVAWSCSNYTYCFQFGGCCVSAQFVLSRGTVNTWFGVNIGWGLVLTFAVYAGFYISGDKSIHSSLIFMLSVICLLTWNSFKMKGTTARVAQWTSAFSNIAKRTVLVYQMLTAPSVSSFSCALMISRQARALVIICSVNTVLNFGCLAHSHFDQFGYGRDQKFLLSWSLCLQMD